MKPLIRSLLAVGLFLAGIAAWSVFGTIENTVSGEGVLLPGGSASTRRKSSFPSPGTRRWEPPGCWQGRECRWKRCDLRPERSASATPTV